MVDLNEMADDNEKQEKALDGLAKLSHAKNMKQTMMLGGMD